MKLQPMWELERTVLSMSFQGEVLCICILKTELYMCACMADRQTTIIFMH